MRRTILIAAVSALLFGLAAVLSVSAVSQADDHRRDRSTTLLLDVRFSPQALIAANNERDPNRPFALGDENVFHDLLFMNGEQVGDEVGSCVIVALTPEILANCSLAVRSPTATSPASSPPALAPTRNPWR